MTRTMRLSPDAGASLFPLLDGRTPPGKADVPRFVLAEGNTLHESTEFEHPGASVGA